MKKNSWMISFLPKATKYWRLIFVAWTRQAQSETQQSSHLSIFDRNFSPFSWALKSSSTCGWAPIFPDQSAHSSDNNPREGGSTYWSKTLEWGGYWTTQNVNFILVLMWRTHRAFRQCHQRRLLREHRLCHQQRLHPGAPSPWGSRPGHLQELCPKVTRL